MKTWFRTATVAAVLAVALSGTASAQALRPGFDANALAANDDLSTGLIALGFQINFFGSLYNNAFLNNNGNMTFDAALGTFTPFSLITTTRVIIAPFFADVDTRVGPLMQYGTGTVNGRNAFGVTWDGVCFFAINCNNVNSFQVVLIDRSDIAAGDFDIEFNYNYINWETGQASGGDALGLGGNCARAGFSNGTTFAFELTGSAVCGAFLDGGPNALAENSFNSNVTGRYVYGVRGGTPTTAVPEPITVLLLAGGLIGIGALRRR